MRRQNFTDAQAGLVTAYRRATMTAALVDDSRKDIELLYQDLSRYCQNHNIHMYIEKFENEDAFLESMEHTAYNLADRKSVV